MNKKKSKGFQLPYEKKIYSQSGEDGIIEFLLDKIENKNFKSVEIGWGDGVENNTRHLLENGYECLAYDMIENQTVSHPRLNLKIKKIDIFNSLEILEWNQSPDFFSLDIDSIDWYLLRNLLKNKFQPKIICCEYNAWVGELNFGVIKPNVRFTRSGLYGASVSSFNSLLEEYGYKLFTVNTQGVNVFYYHESIFNKDFESVERFTYKDCKARFRRKKYGDIHWWDEFQDRFFINRNEVEDYIKKNNLES